VAIAEHETDAAPDRNRVSREDRAARDQPAEGLIRVVMTVAYDGMAYHGVAPQADVTTVGGELQRLVATVLRQPGQPSDVDLVVAGRTDAGVHAWGQVVHVDVDPARFTAVSRGQAGTARAGVEGQLMKLQRSSVKLLGPMISVRTVDVAPPGFHARFSATWRRYRYVIDTRAVGDPFTARYCWHVGRSVDLAAMRLAADAVLGEHDFASFCKAPEPGASSVRKVHDAHWLDLGGGFYRLEIVANAFCQNMVRSLVGHFVDVGLGRRRAGDVLGVIRAADRSLAGPVAPAAGLCLIDVGYPPEVGYPVLPSTIPDSPDDTLDEQHLRRAGDVTNDQRDQDTSITVPHMFLTNGRDTHYVRFA
jgi:tRNA pseudouridine38-40 synthase